MSRIGWDRVEDYEAPEDDTGMRGRLLLLRVIVLVVMTILIYRVYWLQQTQGDELQTLADSSDKLKRGRGRRGLNVLSRLQASPHLDLSIDDADVPGRSVDHKLLQMASDQNLRVLTTDYNLDKVAEIQGVPVLNLNEMARSLKPQVVPGEAITVDIVKRGEAAQQGVGYLPDGTMVVVEEAADHIGGQITAIVTNSLQTSAGRMIFGRRANQDEARASAVARMANAATHQPPDRK